MCLSSHVHMSPLTGKNFPVIPKLTFPWVSVLLHGELAVDMCDYGPQGIIEELFLQCKTSMLEGICRAYRIQTQHTDNVYMFARRP